MSFAILSLRCRALAVLAGWLALTGSAMAEVRSSTLFPSNSTARQIIPSEPQLPVPTDPMAQPAALVRIINASKGDFSYQISRSSGPTWTAFYTLPTAMMHTFTADRLRQPSIIATLNVYSNPGYVYIRFPVPGGFEVFKILTGNSYTYLVNANGYGELSEGTGTTPKIPAGMQGQALFELDANHSFYTRQPDVAAPPLSSGNVQQRESRPPPAEAPAPAAPPTT